MIEPLRLAVLISGTGRTLKNLLDEISAGRLPARVELVISSHAEAGGLEFARAAEIPAQVFPAQGRSSKELSAAIFAACREARVDYVLMAGFIKHVEIPDDFTNRVLNIHPSLIPAFCGQGYYGARVHRAVLEFGAKVSGCTVHFVDNEYDHGPIIHQETVAVRDDDTPESLAARVFEAECRAYPTVLRWLSAGQLEVHGRRVARRDV